MVIEAIIYRTCQRRRRQQLFIAYWKQPNIISVPYNPVESSDCHIHIELRVKAISQRSFHIWIISCGDTIKLLPYPSSHKEIKQTPAEERRSIYTHTHTRCKQSLPVANWQAATNTTATPHSHNSSRKKMIIIMYYRTRLAYTGR